MELIRFVNDVLLAVGERPQVSLSTPVGRKAALAVRDAVEDFQLANNWSFLKIRTTPISKTGTALVITSLRQVQSVLLKERILNPVNIEELYSNAQYSFAILGDDSIEVSQDLVGEPAADFSIYGYTQLVINPDLDNFQIPVPDRFLPIVRTQTIYRLAIDHLGDGNLANIKASEFTRMVQAYQSRETGVGRRQQNLYRKRS